MDQFVTEFSKNPQKWRALLNADQREKIQTFVDNIADVTPKTDRLALEARIIARRHPHVTVVNEEDLNNNRVVLVEKTPPLRRDSLYEEIYSDEAKYESDESEDDYIPKAESESE